MPRPINRDGTDAGCTRALVTLCPLMSVDLLFYSYLDGVSVPSIALKHVEVSPPNEYTSDSFIVKLFINVISTLEYIIYSNTLSMSTVLRIEIPESRSP
jgi:hypothetical protein